MSSVADNKPIVQDNDYISRSGEKNDPIPVQSDDAPVGGVSGDQDSDEQLIRDDREAIDESNVVEGRTRGAKPAGSYREPGDEEGLPGPGDGTSDIAQ
ncbi:hypothetical protein PVAG01_01567 [Phlyctema vagabunda]|uniref:Histone chaperone domain-containing protein n=1 Tax=Phlyctema vagabunda TaxID=108571 RepID=A0ABR4PXH2_9HELO